MYVTVGKLGRNTIQVKFLVELQMDLQLHQTGLKLLNQLHMQTKIVTGNMYSKSVWPNWLTIVIVSHTFS
jgi:hypothetical protein